MHQYWTYIVASQSRVLYVGVTNNLQLRVTQHRRKAIAGFTSRYNCNRLVWYESFRRIEDAIAAEKRIKGWTRAKKITLIEELNPAWEDLEVA